MKKYIIYLAALFAFAGCQNDIKELNITLTSQHSLTVSLPTVDDSTRVEFTDGESSISLNWEQGDTFTIYNSSGSKVGDYEYSASSDNNSALFTAVSGVNQLLDGGSYTAVFPAIEGVTTLSSHRTALAARISEQTQVGNNSTDHLNDALRMEAQFTYSGDSDTQVTFAHTLATMRITFALEDGAVPTALEFRDGDYEVYTINMNETSASDSYTAYYVINPNEGAERTLTFIITTVEDELQLFGVTSSVTYSVGQNYVASVPGLTTAEIPDGYTPIYTALDLYNVRKYLSGNYIVMNDINLSGYDNWTPIGSGSSSSFKGTFDGGGHIITGLKISGGQGLFGYVNGGAIKNLIIKDAQVSGGSNVGAVCGQLKSSGSITACGVEGGSVSGSDYVGGVVGSSYSSSVTACYNTGSVSGSGFNVGGVVGESDDSTVTACYNTGSVSGSDDVGGVVGESDDSSVTACYNTGAVSSSMSAGGIVGGTHGSTQLKITACYNTGSISGGDHAGGIAGSTGSSTTIYITSCYNIGDISGCRNFSDSAGGIFSGTGNGGCTIYIVDCYYISGVDYTYGAKLNSLSELNDIVTTMNSAAGEEYFTVSGDSNILPSLFDEQIVYDVTYIEDLVIGSIDDLKEFRYLVNMGWAPKTATLTTNLDLSGEVWISIGNSKCPCTTEFNGDDYTISNVSVSSGGYYHGLFGYVNGGTISNLTLKNPQISGSHYVGAICGYLKSGDISNCRVEEGSVYSSFEYAGGIVGYASSSTIKLCYNTSTVSMGRSRDYAGGIAGYATSSSIVACYNTGSIYGSGGSGYIGGIAGGASSIIACYTTGYIKGSSYVGGVAGSSSSVTASYFINRDDDAVYGIGGNTSSIYKLTSVSELNAEVSTMNTAANAELGTTDVTYYTAGSQTDTHLPYLFDENLLYE